MTTDALAIALKAQERIGGTYLLDLPEQAAVDADSEPGAVLVTVPSAAEEFVLTAKSAYRCKAKVQLTRKGAELLAPMSIDAVTSADGTVTLRLLAPA